MDDQRRISQSLYVSLNSIIGPEEIIHIRRTTTNLRDKVYRSVKEMTNSELIPYFSGSRAEGLRFTSSDEDWMFVHRHIKVISSDRFASLYDCNTILLKMENDITKPGFALLRVIDQSKDIRISESRSPFVRLLNGRYVSSKLWRELHTETSPDQIYTHGPCSSGKIGNAEFDWAYCLQCDIWPANAQLSVHRMLQSSWPSFDTLRSIINDGVLFVAIGAKQSFFEDTEWRMSFSLAEKRLIYTMNHTQFLCYAFLKVFLKEAIDVNRDIKGLLCSYFLKTALFWEIVESPNILNPSSLFRCFWNCIRRLLQWVNSSYCPNFFIPENNMFEGKIEGENRSKLLQHLTSLYHESCRCLLRCNTLPLAIHCVINSRDGRIYSGPTTVSRIGLDIIREVYTALHLSSDIVEMNKLVEPACLILNRFMSTSNDVFEQFIIKNWLQQSLSHACMIKTIKASTGTERHKCHYADHVTKMNVLKRCRLDSSSHYLHQAMLCYKIGDYQKSL